MPLDAHSHLSVDVSYLVADLKYNKKQGVKICEIQQASLSLFNGDSYRDMPEEKSIHKELLRTLELYNKKGWVLDEELNDKNLVGALGTSADWTIQPTLISLFSDEAFVKASKIRPQEPDDISSYAGFLYANWKQLSVIYDYETRLPGMVVLDKATFPFWVDKFAMTELFQDEPLLIALKPKWGNYKKSYTTTLAAEIVRELGGETFVIKPRGEFLGRGVVIAQKDELDEILKFIITKEGPLSENTDPAYAAWKTDRFDSFIVEEFVMSDPITIAHIENKTYQPTMRVAFVLGYDKGVHSVHFLGSYWKTPEVSLDDPGSFIDKHKDICKPPYYDVVEPSVLAAVEAQLSDALPVLHRKMIQYSENANTPVRLPAAEANVTIVLDKKEIA